MKRHAATSGLVLALVLAGCGGSEREAGKGAAGGEILPGSASDAMLPLDTVRSQPPLAPKSESSGPAKAAPKGSAAATVDASAPAEATQPAADPVPEPADEE